MKKKLLSLLVVLVLNLNCSEMPENLDKEVGFEEALSDFNSQVDDLDQEKDDKEAPENTDETTKQENENIVEVDNENKDLKEDEI